MKLRLPAFVLIVVLVMAGTAIAGTDIDADPLNQTIVIGEIGTYNITVRTDKIENHSISFNTYNDLLVAKLTGQGVNTGALNRTGSGNWTPTEANKGYNFTFMVKPLSGISYDDHDMAIFDRANSSELPVEVSPIVVITVVPIPELTTFTLVGIGLIGLVALRRRKE